MEKIIKLPENNDNIISPADVKSSDNLLITVWVADKLIGFVHYDEQYWCFIKGTVYEESSEELSDILRQYPKYTFKLNTVD